jgi:hypothetical protein
LFRAKKSEIRRRAKRLLSAFANESRRQNFASEQRKILRARYEKGLLVVKEDFVRLPTTPNLQFQIINNLLSVLKKSINYNQDYRI